MGLVSGFNLAKTKQIKAGRAIAWLIRLTYWSPRWLVVTIAIISGWIGLLTKSRNSRVTLKNLELCFPEMPEHDRRRIAMAQIRHNALMTKEVATAWLGSESEIRHLLAESCGDALITSAQQAHRPLVLAVPHIGNWEYFWHWLQLKYPAISMYSPAQYQKLDQIMLSARQKFGGRPFATDTKGIMGLMRALKQGGIMMILPDQVPKNEGGVYVPFFNHPAYTMTLLHKFIDKTGAQLCFGSAIRQANGKFKVLIESADFETSNQSIEDFNTLMNQQLETIIRRHPEQYQWNYKRFKRQAKEENYYH